MSHSVFVIGDSAGSLNGEYLLDYQDYDPNSSVKLPGRLRLNLSTK